MRNLFRKFEALLMAATFAEANDRKSALDSLKEVFGRSPRLESQKESRKYHQDRQQERQRLRL